MAELINLIKNFVFSAITGFIVVGILDGDVYKGIFIGVFIFLSVILLPTISDSIKQQQWGNSFFSKDLWGTLVYSLIILTLTSLISGILFSYFVDYCNKDSAILSEKRCAMQKAGNTINEQYNGPYDYEGTP